MTSEAAPTQTNSRTQGLIFLTVFLDLLGFGLMIPVQPFFAESFGARPATITLLQASYSAMQFLFGPFWGRLSDRIGRRPVLLVSIAMSATGFLLFGLAQSLPWLFAARLLAGFGNANIGTAQAALADSSDAAGRTRAMGLVGAGFGLGFILGPVAGGILAQWGPRAPAFAAAALGALNLVLALRFLPETLSAERRSTGPGLHPLHPRAVREVFQQRALGHLLSMSLLVTASFAMMEAALSLFIERTWVPEAAGLASGSVALAEAHKRAAGLTATCLLVVGLVGAVIQGRLIGGLVARFGEASLTRVGLIAMAMGLLAVPLAAFLGPFWTLIVPAAVLMAVGSSLVNPTVSALISKAAGSQSMGRVLGLGVSLSALGRVVGPAAAGRCFEVSPALPFYVGAAGLAAASWVARTIGRDDE